MAKTRADGKTLPAFVADTRDKTTGGTPTVLPPSHLADYSFYPERYPHLAQNTVYSAQTTSTRTKGRGNAQTKKQGKPKAQLDDYE